MTGELTHARPQQIRSAKHAPSPENDSNRGQRENQIYSNKSLGYVWSVGKRWDTSDISSIFGATIVSNRLLNLS